MVLLLNSRQGRVDTLSLEFYGSAVNGVRLPSSTLHPLVVRRSSLKMSERELQSRESRSGINCIFCVLLSVVMLTVFILV
jgi:hypothetical protein